jgi:hypothetical protein
MSLATGKCVSLDENVTGKRQRSTVFAIFCPVF